MSCQGVLVVHSLIRSETFVCKERGIISKQWVLYCAFCFHKFFDPISPVLPGSLWRIWFSSASSDITQGDKVQPPKIPS